MFDDLEERHDAQCEGDSGGRIRCLYGSRQRHRVLAEVHALRAVVEAARGVLDIRPMGSWEREWDVLRAALDELDGAA